MNLNELRDEAHQNAKDHGWHDEKVHPLAAHALIHSEISEATEEVRSRIGAEEAYYYGHNGKPEGEAVELADAVIRIADYFGLKGWDLDTIVKIKMDYNRTRPYRHGGKRY